MRLIDADSIPWFVEGVGEIPVITKEEIDQLPTVDIPTVGESVGVIRCKDCKHFKQSDAWDRIEMWCDYHHGDFDTWESLENDEGFCSWAERKE